MMHLLFADLRRHASSWTWACVVAVVAGACVSGQFMVMHGSLRTASAATGVNQWGISIRADMTDAAHTVSAFIIASVVLATAAVLTSTAALVIAEHQRDHGLWRALGMRPGTLRAILLGQLAVVGAVGSLGGGALGWPVARAMVPLLIDQEVALPGTTPQWETGDLIWTAVVVAGAEMIGGWGPARRAARATEMELIAGRGGAGNAWSLRRLLGVLTRIALVGGFATGVVAAAVTARSAGAMTDEAINAVILGSFSALGLVCVLTPGLVPLLERLLGLLPARGPAWLVATRTASLQSRRSAATVLPFLVAIGLVAVMFGATHAGFGNMRLSGFLAMFSLALVTAWSGGVAVIAMSASGRRRDAALLEAAGARERTVLAAQVLEGALHAGAAVILGLLVSVATSAFMAAASGAGVLATIVRGPWGELGVVGGLALATTCLAVVASARAGRERSVGEVLRARE
ncbi:MULTISPECIES: FtsX-like permease family protein [unclassified Actinomyces]|uniref:FtsX-like permease family protein n=1 Tax=unclassified Actinomyces TaxID=2609248 RepID=UPI000D58E9B8|nr:MULTISPECIES: FtsX-like permease family protein [unclassified Actinomyces]RAX22014.1 ABC transporter permease [Actinomyces sp. Z3]